MRAPLSSGPCEVPDEQRVAGQHDPVVDEERAVLGPVARCVQDTHRHGADLDHLVVGERLERELRLGDRMHGDRQAVVDREAAVPRDVIGVRMGLEHALDPDALGGRRIEERLDLERGVDDDRDAGGRVADEVGRAAEIVVHELPKEQHGW